MEIFCYIINVFTVTFHQCNASLLNKVLLLLNIIDPKLLNSNVGLYMSVRIHRLQTTKLVWWAYQTILACVFLKSYSTISA